MDEIAETTVIARVDGTEHANGDAPEPIVGEPLTKKKKSIALLAHSQRTRDMAPFQDDDWLVLGLNNVHRFIPKGNMWIQIHSPEYLAKHAAYSKEDMSFYETMQIPLFAQRHYPQWPTSIPLPLREMQKMFPRISWDSTMCYMIGLAIYMIETGWFPGDVGKHNVPERRFGVWGFDALDSYSQQGPTAGYLFGWAEAHGIEVVVPSASGFFRRTWLYGYEDKAIGKRRSQIETRNTELNAQLQQVSNKAQEIAMQAQGAAQKQLAIQAAIEENKYQFKNWLPSGDEEVVPPETLRQAAQQQQVLVTTAK